MTGDPQRDADCERLELALQAAGLGEFQWDLKNGTLLVSRRMSEITGIPAGLERHQIGGIIEQNTHPDDREAFVLARDAALKSADDYDITLRFVRPTDGDLIWMRMAGIITRDAAGAVRLVTGIVQDVSREHREEENRRQLMSELDHRVKNVLATVQSLAIQTAKRTTSLETFLESFGGRLKAMASANELLTAARWRGAAIEHLVAAELGALAPRQTAWSGPELYLTPRAANALSLALHELTTNAVKFGALSNDLGLVEVRWTERPEGGFRLVWSETGGPPVAQPDHKGFGATLLDQVTGHELNGGAKVEYLRGGLRAELQAGANAMAQRPEVLPEAPAVRVAETVPTATGPANLKGVRVLIVEDAVLLALELETGLSDAGASIVGPAYELDEAMGLLDQPIDAAVLDANLNGQSVTPVAEALAARGVPFVFATGYGDSGVSGDFHAPIIRKPYDVTQVAAAVAELLSRSGQTLTAKLNQT